MDKGGRGQETQRSTTITSHHKCIRESIRLKEDPHHRSLRAVNDQELLGEGAPKFGLVGLQPADYRPWDFLASIIG